MLNYQLIERYGFLVIALEFMTLGIIFTIHGNLGITPISCPVYVLSLGFSPTLGEFTIAMHILFVIIQIESSQDRRLSLNAILFFCF